MVGIWWGYGEDAVEMWEGYGCRLWEPTGCPGRGGARPGSRPLIPDDEWMF